MQLRGRWLAALALGVCLIVPAKAVEACMCESVTPFRKLALSAPVVVLARMESHDECTAQPQGAPFCLSAEFRVVETLRGEFREAHLRIYVNFAGCRGVSEFRRGEMWAFTLPSEPYPLDDYGLAGRKGYVQDSCANSAQRIRTHAAEKGILIQDLRRWVR